MNILELYGICIFAVIIGASIIGYNMTVWIWVGNSISFSIAADLIRLHMPDVK